jgi:hypothetical protein
MSHPSRAVIVSDWSTAERAEENAYRVVCNFLFGIDGLARIFDQNFRRTGARRLGLQIIV